jgi:quinol monooxygenase YgiN
MKTAGINVITRYKVKDHMEGKFNEQVKTFQQKSIEETGCAQYDHYQDVNNTNFGIFNEIWNDNDAIGIHMGSDHFKSFMAFSSEALEKLGESKDNPFQVTIAELFDPENPPTDETVIIATKLRVKPENSEQFIDYCKRSVLEPSRKEAGCRGYDLYRNRKDKDIYILFEQWDGFSSIQEHMGTTHFNKFMGRAPEMLVPFIPGKEDLFEVMVCKPFQG